MAPPWQSVPRARVATPRESVVSNTDADEFGANLSLSRDGETLAIGASLESSGATGIGGDRSDDSVLESGAVYLY